MAFNVDAALKDGYSEQEIAEYLGKQNKFNASAALKDGYSAKEIIDHLNKPTETGFIGQIGRGIAAYPSQTQETVGGGQALLGEALRQQVQRGCPRPLPPRLRDRGPVHGLGEGIHHRGRGGG